jgi:hexosaminidase
LKLKIFKPLLLLWTIHVVYACQHTLNNQPDYRREHEVSIIPQVADIDMGEGLFKIDKNTSILVLNDTTTAAYFLKDHIDRVSNFTIPIIRISNEGFDKKQNFIFIDNTRKFIYDEGYELKIDSNAIYLSGMNNRAVLHGVQSMRQLFIDEFTMGDKKDDWYLPQLKITDFPMFPHRGLLLDCSRHFFTKDVIKKYIEVLSFYKMNVLHWHLTEDQGWRLEIDAYPKLTEVGAWRTEDNETDRYGGFYTKEDVRELVAFANSRGVTIIPEIELPGHSQAAIAAYPQLSCTGEQVSVATDWGVFKEIYCAGNDSVFIFLETVLDEVMALFPSKYIHIGGDEVPKFRWEHCLKCQKRMKDHGLKDEQALQSYFIARIEQYLNAHGRQLIGWDEILEGGLSNNATVQSWRGMEGGMAAASAEHHAIMSPTSHAYFDYSLQSIDLEKVYEFDPIPNGLDKDKYKFIIGGECNMWTEHVPTENDLDCKVFPRLLAMSEVLWSYPKDRDFEAFYQRVQQHYPFLAAFGIAYGAAAIPISTRVEIKNTTAFMIADTRDQSLTIKYRWLSNADTTFETYQIPLQIAKYDTIVFQAFKHKKEYGKPIVKAVSYHKAIGEVIKYKSIYNQWYEGGGATGLVDGNMGSHDFKDGCWQGFWGSDFEATIDLGEVTEITHLETHFFQYNNSWIFMPTEIVFEGSLEGDDFYEIGKMDSKTDPKARGKHIENYIHKVNKIKMRYIKLKAKNIGKVPSWHEAAGSDAWLFIDEIIVK